MFFRGIVGSQVSTTLIITSSASSVALLEFKGPVASVIRNNLGSNILTFHPQAFVFLCGGTLVLFSVATSEDITM